MIVEEGKIAIDPLKLGGIRDWPIPKFQCHETSQVFPRVWQILQMIYSSFFRTGKTVKQFNEEGQKIQMDQQMSNCI